MVWSRRRQPLARDPASFLGKPAQEVGTVTDLEPRCLERLTLLHGHQMGKLIGLIIHKLPGPHQDVGSGIGRGCRPACEGGVRSLYGQLSISGCAIGHLANLLASSRIRYIERRPTLSVDPFSIDEHG